MMEDWSIKGGWSNISFFYSIFAYLFIFCLWYLIKKRVSGEVESQFHLCSIRILYEDKKEYF